MFDSFRRNASSNLISSAILNINNPISNLLQNIAMQQQTFRIAKYILLHTRIIILICNDNGLIDDPIVKTEVSNFALSPSKMYNHSEFAMYLVYYGRLGFWHKIYHMTIIHAPSILAGMHAISKRASRSFPFYDSRCVPLYLLFFLMLLLLTYFWQIHKCIKMQLDSLSFHNYER